MIIQHNLASMGASRQSKITTSRKARISERLASGYRINRAADDAAGLKISQKMRVQIRGLAQANENIQDGINFVKVGESGMQEVHEILQRIRGCLSRRRMIRIRWETVLRFNLRLMRSLQKSIVSHTALRSTATVCFAEKLPGQL